MLIKSSTIVASAVLALLHNKGSQQRQALFIAAAIATLVLLKLFATTTRPNAGKVTKAVSEEAVSPKNTAMKWRYDEMAHKLIMENRDLAYEELEQHFSQGVSKALIKVTRQIDGKPVIVNL